MKLRKVRFAARVHFLDACINAITFKDVGQTRGQTMANGKLRHGPCYSCRVLHPFGKAGGSHIAPHAICWYTCPARP